MVKVRHPRIVRCPVHGETSGTRVIDTVTGNEHHECGTCGFTFHFIQGFRPSARLHSSDNTQTPTPKVKTDE